MGTTIQASPYVEKVKLIRSMAAARYGREVIERQTEPSDERTWRFRDTISGGYVDDPLFWRLDTYEDGVNAYTIFQLYDEVTEELVEQRFIAMEVSREEFLEDHRFPMQESDTK